MTAALLRNELFHHLLATSPEKTGSENARAGALALAFHGVIALLLLQLPTASHPPAPEIVHAPIVMYHNPLEAYPQPPSRGATSGTGIGGPPSILPPSILPDVGLPNLPNFSIGNEPKPISMDPPPLTRGGGAGVRGGDGGSGGGNFIVVQNAPRMLNANHIAGLLRREYPALLLQSGIGGTVVLHVLIDLDGRVSDARVWQSSGIAALDNAALRVSREMQFSPAQSRDQTVRVWAAIPVLFSARD